MRAGAVTGPLLGEVPAQIITAHFYLDDIDLDLAPTAIIAGSHRAGRSLPGRVRVT